MQIPIAVKELGLVHAALVHLVFAILSYGTSDLLIEASFLTGFRSFSENSQYLGGRAGLFFVNGAFFLKCMASTTIFFTVYARVIFYLLNEYKLNYSAAALFGLQAAGVLILYGVLVRFILKKSIT